jgi:mono/diheme cytochrome c family protein
MTRSLARALVPCAALTAAACGGAPAGSKERPVSVVRPVAPAGTAPVAVASAAYAGFRDGEAGLTPQERAGREIWYKATGGNGRFHTYVFQQRMGVLIDWYRVLQSPQRDDRFAAWGLINDPDCCTPGSAGCPATSLEQTYGFDWCPGDETLLAFVGKTGYRDPACDFKDADGSPRQDACDLAFGTSTGAMGLRKFPNPRFDAGRWQALGGARPGTWDGYDKLLVTPGRKGRPGVRDSRLLDGSIEPPFLVGMACGACHISFDPTRPPQDPAHPKWENLLGAVGNQYGRFSEIMASGMAKDSPEWQIFTHARPGTVDTSAVPNDQVHNPGTMNAIFNTNVRPAFADEAVPKWRKVAACDASAPAGSCWCEPGRESKCWRRSVQKEAVPHLLKGGEDSIGLEEAVQRVYFNIGVCSEECWVNHLTDFRQIDPQQRNFGQTPFDIGQCRRDCPNFRAIEDRLFDVTAFLKSKETRPPDLAVALKKDADGLVDWLNREMAPGTVDRGRAVFAKSCARCHSSQEGASEAEDFHRTVADAPTLRADWMGNDKATPVSEVGTFECRALHSNHMEGHVWQEYGSDSYRARPADSTAAGASGGGRGYYRNVSLLGTWAFAPFMHNNALGPEVCGRPQTKANDFYLSPYADGAAAAPCVPYDPSVAGRFALYRASMEDLLNPDRRAKKVSLLDEDINLDLGPRTWDGETEKKLAGVTLKFSKGLPASFFGNFQHKAFFDDLIAARTRPQDLKAKYVQRFGPAKGEAVAQEIKKLSDEIGMDFSRLAEIARPHLDTLKEVYLSCGSLIENDGHRFGEALSPEDKKALIAFLATL